MSVILIRQNIQCNVFGIIQFASEILPKGYRTALVSFLVACNEQQT